MSRLQLTRPLAVFDLETTGTSIYEDRIVELAIVTLHPDGRRERYHTRVNPGRLIPKEATAVHGITDDDVRDAPRFEDLADEVARRIRKVDLGGFNVIRFDLPLLQKEFERAGVTFDRNPHHVVDAQVIYHRMEPRNLGAAVRYYCDRELAGAHGALPDAEGTLDVLLAQVERYAQEPQLIPDRVEELDALSQRRDDSFIDREGKIIWVGDQAALGFGKYKGTSLSQLAVDVPEYLQWILRKDFSDDVKDIIRAASEGVFPQK